METHTLEDWGECGLLLCDLGEGSGKQGFARAWMLAGSRVVLGLGILINFTE